MADPFDEFEFKPITEGLGFHKKTVQFKKELDASQSMPSVSLPLKSFERPTEPRTTPAARSPLATPAPTRAPEKARLPFHDFVETPQRGTPTTAAAKSTATSTRPAVTPIRAVTDVSVSIPAIIFDSIVVVGLTCLFAIAVLLIVNVDLLNVLQAARTDTMTMLSLVLLFASVLELYLIIFRSVLGATLGEWAFDIQLGTVKEQQSTYYPLQVIWRSLIVIATGFVTLPLLSLIVRRDLAGLASGVSLKRGENIG